MAAPLLSETVPLREPVSCALANNGRLRASIAQNSVFRAVESLRECRK
jgi:hypothetical protein